MVISVCHLNIPLCQCPRASSQNVSNLRVAVAPPRKSNVRVYRFVSLIYDFPFFTEQMRTAHTHVVVQCSRLPDPDPNCHKHTLTVCRRVATCCFTYPRAQRAFLTDSLDFLPATPFFFCVYPRSTFLFRSWPLITTFRNNQEALQKIATASPTFCYGRTQATLVVVVVAIGGIVA